MASKPTKKPANQPSLKVGSDPNAARQVGGKNDFGARADDKIEREYVSRETKWNDPGAAHDRVKDGDGRRDSGAGAYDSGPGSGSGGDIDTDIVGVGEDASQRDAAAMRNPDANPPVQRVRGSTMDHSGGDLSTTGGGLDNGSASNPQAQAQTDDSFVADIQLDDATGENDAA